jgi:hypothetical protein
VSTDLPEWERLPAAERHLQHLEAGSVPDGDHVLGDLRERFDEVLAQLESVAGWQTDRVQRPVLILGTLEGMLTGIRQMRRTRPLEVEIIDGLRVPTLAEMARIKSWLLATRHTVRDYLDTVVLLERLGEPGAQAAFRELDEIYPQPAGGLSWQRSSSAWPRPLPPTGRGSTSRRTRDCALPGMT